MTATRLGEFLLHQKAINEAQLQDALKAQAAAMTHCFLGDIFIGQQILSEEDFGRLLRQFLRHKAAAAQEEELLLGQLLLDSGKLSIKELDTVLAQQGALDEFKPLGELLVEAGLLTADALEVYLYNQKFMRESRD